MTFSTGNEERDQMLRRAIGEVFACGEATDISFVREHLPNDFGLDDDELAGMLADMKIGIRPTPPQIEAARAAVIAATDHGSAPPPTLEDGTYVIDPGADIAQVKRAITEAESHRQLDAANAELSARREKLVNAQVIQRQRRADLAAAIRDWQLLSESASTGLSAEARRQVEVRNHLASTQAERAARGKASSSAKAHVWSRMRNGPSRGAYSRQAAARSGFINRDVGRGAVPKLPAER